MRFSELNSVHVLLKICKIKCLAYNRTIVLFSGDGLTILASKKKIVPITKIEVIHFLKAYEENPCSWSKILEKMSEIYTSLPIDAQQLYLRSTAKQLKLRLSTKLGKLMTTPMDKLTDDEIR